MYPEAMTPVLTVQLDVAAGVVATHPEPSHFSAYVPLYGVTPAGAMVRSHGPDGQPGVIVVRRIRDIGWVMLAWSLRLTVHNTSVHAPSGRVPSSVLVEDEGGAGGVVLEVVAFVAEVGEEPVDPVPGAADSVVVPRSSRRRPRTGWRRRGLRPTRIVGEVGPIEESARYGSWTALLVTRTAPLRSGLATVCRVSQVTA